MRETVSVGVGVGDVSVDLKSRQQYSSFSLTQTRILKIELCRN